MTKKGVIYLAVVLLLFCSACGKTSDNAPTPTPEPMVKATATPAPTAEPTVTLVATSAPTASILTEDEIKFFNENFFSTETKYPGRWLRNNILHREFETPAQVDIRAMLYDEPTEELSNAESEYLKTQMEEVFDTSRFTTAYINELLQTYLGISLEESEKKGLDSLFYYAEEDAYYLVRSDAMCVFVHVESGVHNEDGTIALVYMKSNQPFTNMNASEIEALPQYQVVLKEVEKGYQFVSNCLIKQ